jgi:hypothetical protein
MNVREIKRYLNDLDAGRVTRKQKEDAERHAGRISEWLQTPDGRQFLFGKPAAALRKAKAEWREDAEATSLAFSNQCGGLPDDKQAFLVRLFMDFAYRGFSAIAAELRAVPRESGVTLAEEGREKLSKTISREVAERRKWVRTKYKAIRPEHKAGSRGDKATRDQVAREFFKAFGWFDEAKGKQIMGDMTIRRYLRETPKNKGGKSRKRTL